MLIILSLLAITLTSSLRTHDNLNEVLQADITCCVQHEDNEAGCAGETGSKCHFIDDPTHAVAIDAGSQCVGESYWECKKDDVEACCAPACTGDAPPKIITPPDDENEVNPVLECGPPPAPVTAPTVPPAPLCELGVNYAFEGYPCQISGDPHTKQFNGNNHDFQGQPDPDNSVKEQFYYLHHCHGSSTDEMPFNVLGRHYHWGHRDVSGMDYFTFELYDNNGDIYFMFLSSGINKYVKHTAGVSTLYDTNVDNGVTMHTLGHDAHTSIGNRFSVHFKQTTNSRIDVVLTIDGKCDVNLFMQAQPYSSVNGRYAMHYLQLTQSSCYKCVTCGLCGNFKDFMTGAHVEQMEMCDGEYTDYRAGWYEWATPEAYDPDGWSWEKSFTHNNCGQSYDITANNGDFVFVDPCDSTIQPAVVAECDDARANLACCADVPDLCNDAVADCYYDACVEASGPEGDSVEDAVANIFTNAIGVACTLPNIADDFNPHKLTEYEHLGCYNDKSTRALDNGFLGLTSGDRVSLDNAAKVCSAHCAGIGAKYFALEWNIECFCDDSLADAVRYGQDGADCIYHGYGGDWAFDLYKTLSHIPGVDEYMEIFEDRWPHCTNLEIADFSASNGCFSGKTLEELKEACDITDECVGFSYNGSGGCFKQSSGCSNNGFGTGSHGYYSKCATREMFDDKAEYHDDGSCPAATRRQNKIASKSVYAYKGSSSLLDNENEYVEMFGIMSVFAVLCGGIMYYKRRNKDDKYIPIDDDNKV